MTRRRKRKLNTKITNLSPSVDFKDLYPSETGGNRKHKGIDLPPNPLDEGNESRFKKCLQCGFLLDTETTGRGDGEGNVKAETWYPTTTNLSDYTLGGSITGGDNAVTVEVDQEAGRQITATYTGCLRWIVAKITNAASVEFTGAIYTAKDSTLLSNTYARTYAAGTQWIILETLSPINVSVGDELYAVLGSEVTYDLHYASAGGRGIVAAQDYDYFPAARVPAWTASDYDYDIYLSKYPKGGYNFRSDPRRDGCPFCHASNW